MQRLTLQLPRDDQFRTLKMHTNEIHHHRELQIYELLKSLALEQSDHGGKEHLRELYDFFKVDGPHGTHDVFILQPLGTSIRNLQLAMPDGILDQEIAQQVLVQILPTIHFLHTEANVIHTGSSDASHGRRHQSTRLMQTVDIHTGNILEGIRDERLLVTMEQDELGRAPSPRKDAGDRTIYATRHFCESVSILYLCDLGEAVVGNEHEGRAMPKQYRAPEIILGMKWGHAIDMWSVGVMVLDSIPPPPPFLQPDSQTYYRKGRHRLV